MIAALIITLRETLEASLVVGIVLAYLRKTKNDGHVRYVWFGVLAGILLSLVLAWLFETYLGGFEGRSEELYEGIMMLTAAALLTWMILWMLTQRKHIKSGIEKKVSSHIEGDNPVGIFFLVFVAVVREGIETVIFLQAALIASDNGSVLTGGVLGIVIAIIISWLLFRGFAKVPLKKFFAYTSVLLILFAAGLVAHGIHELQEAMVLPVLVEHIWDMNWLLDEKGTIGGLFKGVFGYNGNPSLIEVLGYLVYLLVITAVWKRMDFSS